MKNINLGGKALTILGFVATGAGFVVSLVSDWVGGKQTESMIKEEVAKQLQEALKK